MGCWPIGREVGQFVWLSYLWQVGLWGTGTGVMRRIMTCSSQQETLDVSGVDLQCVILDFGIKLVIEDLVGLKGVMRVATIDKDWYQKHGDWDDFWGEHNGHTIREQKDGAHVIGCFHDGSMGRVKPVIACMEICQVDLDNGGETHVGMHVIQECKDMVMKVVYQIVWCCHLFEPMEDHHFVIFGFDG